jgi:hypothetical protein
MVVIVSRVCAESAARDCSKCVDRDCRTASVHVNQLVIFVFDCGDGRRRVVAVVRRRRRRRERRAINPYYRARTSGGVGAGAEESAPRQ